MANKVVLAALQHIWTVLEPTGCPRALVGGLSLSFWKHVRSTQDVDLLIDPTNVGIEAILDLLKQVGIRTRRQPAVVDLGAVRVVQLLYEPKEAFMDVQIDLLLAESVFHKEALARRVPVRLTSVEFQLFTLSCEDLLILKMNAGRIIDRADGASLLRFNRASLDIPYLVERVAQFNLHSEWTEIWRESAPGEPVPR